MDRLFLPFPVSSQIFFNKTFIFWTRVWTKPLLVISGRGALRYSLRRSPGLSGLCVHQLHLHVGGHATPVASLGLHLVLNGADLRQERKRTGQELGPLQPINWQFGWAAFPRRVLFIEKKIIHLFIDLEIVFNIWGVVSWWLNNSFFFFFLAKTPPTPLPYYKKKSFVVHKVLGYISKPVKRIKMNSSLFLNHLNLQPPHILNHLNFLD